MYRMDSGVSLELIISTLKYLSICARTILVRYNTKETVALGIWILVSPRPVRGEWNRKARACRLWFYPFARALAMAQGPKGQGDPSAWQPHLFSSLPYITKQSVG